MQVEVSCFQAWLVWFFFSLRTFVQILIICAWVWLFIFSVSWVIKIKLSGNVVRLALAGAGSLWLTLLCPDFILLNYRVKLLIRFEDRTKTPPNPNISLRSSSSCKSVLSSAIPGINNQVDRFCLKHILDFAKFNEELRIRVKFTHKMFHRKGEN